MATYCENVFLGLQPFKALQINAASREHRLEHQVKEPMGRVGRIRHHIRQHLNKPAQSFLKLPLSLNDVLDNLGQVEVNVFLFLLEHAIQQSKDQIFGLSIRLVHELANCVERVLLLHRNLLLLLVLLLLAALHGLVVGFEMVVDGALDFNLLNLALLHLRLLLLSVVSALSVSTEVVVTLSTTFATFWRLNLVSTALFAVLSLVVFTASIIASVAAPISVISVFAAASVIIIVVVVVFCAPSIPSVASVSIPTVVPVIHIAFVLVLLQHLLGNFFLGLNAFLFTGLGPLRVLVLEQVLDKNLDTGGSTVLWIFGLKSLKLGQTRENGIQVLLVLHFLIAVCHFSNPLLNSESNLGHEFNSSLNCVIIDVRVGLVANAKETCENLLDNQISHDLLFEQFTHKFNITEKLVL